MISITVPARMVPTNTSVRKPTGHTWYLVKRQLDLYVQGEGSTRPVTADPGTLFLYGERTIQVVPADTNVTVDFETCDDAKEFIQDLELHT